MFGKGRQIDEDQGNFDLLDLMESIKSGEAKEESRETEVVELEDIRKLGIATLGALKQHPRISAFRRFIEGWYVSYFTPKFRSQSCPSPVRKSISTAMVTILVVWCSS